MINRLMKYHQCKFDNYSGRLKHIWINCFTFALSYISVVIGFFTLAKLGVWIISTGYVRAVEARLKCTASKALIITFY